MDPTATVTIPFAVLASEYGLEDDDTRIPDGDAVLRYDPEEGSWSVSSASDPGSDVLDDEWAPYGRSLAEVLGWDGAERL